MKEILPTLPGFQPGVIHDKEWQAAGACAQTDPEAFFPEKGESTRMAKFVCQHSCEVGVRYDCLNNALETNEIHGIHGGLSYRERLQLKRELEQQAPGSAA